MRAALQTLASWAKGPAAQVIAFEILEWTGIAALKKLFTKGPPSAAQNSKAAEVVRAHRAGEPDV